MSYTENHHSLLETKKQQALTQLEKMEEENVPINPNKYIDPSVDGEPWNITLYLKQAKTK
ncbi:hypothetical protein KM1_156130 [Entamoeba histolytica HM-3:IMSS]|uniref:Uncharacterized protein n=1 Tax=Entamoeba histolytica HM-3:IMSS TaxID=885315 RepID=M7WVJ8_ENTHI|nr:hypothetical protein KM1_156130 [Entamoeba histolytica HM-3:IMSS]